MIKRGYVEVVELLNKDKQQVVPAVQELQVAQGGKCKRWFDCAKNISLKPFAGLAQMMFEDLNGMQIVPAGL